MTHPGIGIGQCFDSPPGDAAQPGLRRLGFWSAMLTALSAVAALGIAVTTAPARSGPNCQPLVDMGVVESCIVYPYTDVVAYVPTEYVWMAPALLAALCFLVLTVVICLSAPAERRAFGHLAVAMAVISATIHAINYGIQLMVVEPSLLRGEIEGLSLYSQYNPHGIFIALENLGYLVTGVAFLFVAAGFAGDGRLVRAIRYALWAGALLTLGGLIVLALVYGPNLEYRFEVLAILVVWMTMIAAGGLLSAFFRRAGRAA